MEIGFEHIASALIGFLFGLLVSWTTKLHEPPESKLVKEMLELLRRQRNDKPKGKTK